MKKEEVSSHLQVLLRNKNDKVAQALAAFFTHKPQEDLFPHEVVTKKNGVWVFLESGSDLQSDGKYKTWAIYERTVEEDDKET